VKSWAPVFPIPEDSVFAVTFRRKAQACGEEIAPDRWQHVLEEAYWMETDIAARYEKVTTEVHRYILHPQHGLMRLSDEGL
jgi:hypothetical protein